MSRPQLALVQNLELSSPAVPFSQMLADHHAILQGYLDTHVTRNHSDRTIESERRFLTGGFESFVLQDDYPVHVLDQEEEGFVLTGDRLLQVDDCVRLEYIGHNQKKLPASRDYSMIVIAGESGLRADEIRHLDALGPHRDLFYEHNRLQTRCGKATRGSGKRVRKTIFTPFAEATVRVYEERIRPAFPHAKTAPALFLTES